MDEKLLLKRKSKLTAMNMFVCLNLMSLVVQKWI